MKIKKVEIEGFRAYKLKKDGTFDFTIDGEQPSNFVAIYAPNGFGKSSFYDAVEWALTNNLERYAGEHNKNSNKIAARGTKVQKVAQKILRNKEIADDIPAKVDVLTTHKTFTRVLPKPRSNATDLPSGTSKDKKKLAYFRDIILSQDAIDRFLREAKPQERYKRFMDFFGGDAEVTRQEITALLNDNKSALVDLQKERTVIKKMLKEPVDETIFDQFNLLASRLNEAGESLAFASSEFSENTEHEILSAIVSRTHALNSSRDAQRLYGSSLIEYMGRLPELQRTLDSIVDQQPRLKMLTKGVQDAQRYQQLFAAHSKSLADQQGAIRELERLQGIGTHIPIFLSADKKLKASTERQTALAGQKLEKTSELSVLESNAKQYTDALSAADQRVMGLRALLSGSSNVYAEIATHQASLIGPQSELQAKVTSIHLYKADHESIAARLTTLSNILVNADTILNQDMSVLGLPEERRQELHSIYQELALLDAHDQSVRFTQAALGQQMGVLERLVSSGLEYLSTWPTNICPLCQEKHPSADVLKFAVDRNDLLSEVVKQNARELERGTSRRLVLQGQIDAVLQDANNRHGLRLAELRQKLNQLGLKIAKEEREKFSIEARLSAAKKTIETLQSRVWNLGKDELVRQIESELVTLANARVARESQLETANKSIATLKSDLQGIAAQLEQLGLQAENLRSQESFTKVFEFLVEEAISNYEELEAHCASKVDGFLKDIENFSSQVSQTSEACKKLQAVMLTEGTWIDVSVLKSQKDSAEKVLNDAQSLVDSFLETVSRRVGKKVSSNVEEIRAELSSAIDAAAKDRDVLGMKVGQFELLREYLNAFKPYLNTLKLRKSLSKVELKLAQHKLVDEKLTAEREIVFARLSERVGAFFFTDLINSIYSKIDPHPSFKRVEFLPDFRGAEKPGLNIVLKDHAGDLISPILYFSAAQLNILSLSVFLANALHAKNDKGVPLDVILIDDPIQSMDSINILATIDLLRNVSVRFDKQIIISTHDENFFGLLQRKIPTEVFGSKFLQLESFGVVATVD